MTAIVRYDPDEGELVIEGNRLTTRPNIGDVNRGQVLIENVDLFEAIRECFGIGPQMWPFEVRVKRLAKVR